MNLIKIPSNIDYELLFSTIKCKDVCKREIVDATYVILHFLYPTKKYLEKTKYSEGFKQLHSETINKITRNRFSLVKDLLLKNGAHPSGSILIQDNSCQTGVKSIGYKLNEELLNDPGEKWVNLGVNAFKRLDKFIEDGKIKLEQFRKPYQFLIDQYQSNITIDDEVLTYVTALETSLNNRLLQDKGDQSELKQRVNTYIKELKSKIRSIQNKRFSARVSLSNHRLNSVITNLNKELRYYLRINGNRLVEVDLKSSQPYVLGTLLTDRFFTNTKDEFSLYTIYPKLYNNLSYITSESSNTTGITLQIEKSLFNNKEGFPKYFMCGGLETSQEIINYRSLPFNNGFYECLNLNYFQGRFQTPIVKDNIMLLLNLNHSKKRKHIELIQSFKSNFPDINSFIESINGFKSIHSSTAILLQRCESYLFLRVGCKAVNNQLPDVPFLTIHDSILIEEKYSEEVSSILKRSLHSFTNIKPGVSVKVPQDPMDKLESDVEDIWDKLKYKSMN